MNVLQRARFFFFFSLTVTFAPVTAWAASAASIPRLEARHADTTPILRFINSSDGDTRNHYTPPTPTHQNRPSPADISVSTGNICHPVRAAGGPEVPDSAVRGVAWSLHLAYRVHITVFAGVSG